MEMTRLEKFFVNRERKGLGNAARVRRALASLDSSRIHDVLEIGCGIGTVSAIFAQERGWNVIGTDYDPEQIAAAKLCHAEGTRLQFRREDATALSFADGSFDLVIAQCVFHHIPAWREAVGELARVLRPGGVVVWYDHVVSPGVLAILGPLVRAIGICAREDVARAFAEAGFEQAVSRHSPWPIGFDDLVFRKS